MTNFYVWQKHIASGKKKLAAEFTAFDKATFVADANNQAFPNFTFWVENDFGLTLYPIVDDKPQT